MSNLAIQAHNLGKQFRIGERESYYTLRESLTNLLHAPFRAALALRGGTAATQPERRTHWALEDVSFEVKTGEVVGIVGRNGAGKSTLLKILSRITRPTRGHARIYGRIGSLLEVGTGFHPELTGRENIYLNGAILGMYRSEIDRKFDEIVAFADVEKFLDTPVKRFSSGMYVRLAFSVAAHLEPEILLVDEVLAVGDAAFQKKCLGKIGEVAREGRTVFFVSHNMAVVQSLCQRGILLYQGRVAFDGSAADSVAAYLRTIDEVTDQQVLDRTDRRGKGQTRLARVEVSSGEQSYCGLATGRPARFVFHFTQPLASMACLFTIYDHLGQPVAFFKSSVTSPEDAIDASLGTRMVCALDELLLTPGQYRINVALEGNGELQDHLEGAAVFDVEQGTVAGRAVTRATGNARISLPHRWVLPE